MHWIISMIIVGLCAVIIIRFMMRTGWKAWIFQQIVSFQGKWTIGLKTAFLALGAALILLVLVVGSVRVLLGSAILIIIMGQAIRHYSIREQNYRKGSTRYIRIITEPKVLEPPESMELPEPMEQLEPPED
jgi:hypothetical protein